MMMTVGSGGGEVDDLESQPSLGSECGKVSIVIPLAAKTRGTAIESFVDWVLEQRHQLASLGCLSDE